MIGQPFNQRQHHGLVLVVAIELQRREVREMSDMVDKTVNVELHLEGGVPLFEGEHGAPIEPEVAFEKVLAEDLVDPLVLHLFARCQEDRDQVLLRPGAQRQQMLVRHVLALVLGHTLQGDVRIILVEPVEFVEDAGILDLQRRDRTVEIPQAFKMLLHLAAAADDEALLRHVETIECATGKIQLFKNGDALASNTAVADQEGRARQSGQPGADEPCRLPVSAIRLAGADESFIVSAAVMHGKLLLTPPTAGI